MEDAQPEPDLEDKYVTTKLEGSRLGRVEREDCPAEYLDAYDEVLPYPRHGKKCRMCLPCLPTVPVHCPRFARLAPMCVTAPTLMMRWREFVILTVAQELRCTYEWVHHHVVAKKIGALGRDLLKKIGTPEIEAEPGELGLATRYARMLTRNEDIPDGMVDALKAAFGIEGFVDMTVMIGYYGMLARVHQHGSKFRLNPSTKSHHSLLGVCTVDANRDRVAPPVLPCFPEV